MGYREEKKRKKEYEERLLELEKKGKPKTSKYKSPSEVIEETASRKSQVLGKKGSKKFKAQTEKEFKELIAISKLQKAQEEADEELYDKRARLNAIKNFTKSSDLEDYLNKYKKKKK